MPLNFTNLLFLFVVTNNEPIKKYGDSFSLIDGEGPIIASSSCTFNFFKISTILMLSND